MARCARPVPQYPVALKNGNCGFNNQYVEQPASGQVKEVALLRDAMRLGWDQMKVTQGIITNRPLISISQMLKGVDGGFRNTGGTTLQCSSGDIVYVPPQIPDNINQHISALERFVLETVEIYRALAAANRNLAELKGRAAVIPNQSILIVILSLQEAKASSEIENIVTTKDDLFRADISALRSENDHGRVMLDGQLTVVEFSLGSDTPGGSQEGIGGDDSDVGGGFDQR